MINKRGRKEIKKLLLIGIALLSVISLISFIFLVSALTDDDKSALQDELDNLAQSLNDNGYSWLVDYNSIFQGANLKMDLKNGGILQNE